MNFVPHRLPPVGFFRFLQISRESRTIVATKGKIMDFIESFRQSKRTKLTVVSLIGIGFRIYQLVSEGQPVPSELILSAVAIVAAWIGGDSYRPTVKPEVAK